MINKPEFVDLLAEGCEITKKDATQMYDNVFGLLSEVISNGEEVAIPNLGRFKITEHAARTARNPRTNEVINVPAKKAPKFQFSKSVKESVAQL